MATLRVYGYGNITSSNTLKDETTDEGLYQLANVNFGAGPGRHQGVKAKSLKHSAADIGRGGGHLFFGQLLSSYKWWLLARSGSIEAPWLLAAKAYYLDMAVNCFGFGTVGGDLARALVLGSKSKKKATALASVFADRVHGLTVLAPIGVVSIAFAGRQHIGSEYLLLLAGCIIAVVGPGILDPV